MNIRNKYHIDYYELTITIIVLGIVVAYILSI